MRAGHVEEANSLLKQMEETDPKFRSVHQYLGTLYWNQGNYENALDEFRQAAISRGNEKAVKNVEAQQAALRTGGTQGLFRYQLATALAAYADQNGPSFNVASYAYLHERENVMKFLKLARQQHDFGFTDVEVAPQFSWLHSDPEFRQLVADVGLPPIQ
jgi:tetratricopeptide (TPR) repeat protein